MLFKFQWTVKHDLEQGRRCGVCLAITAGCASTGGKSCHGPVTWQQGVWCWDQQRAAWTYKHSVVLSIALASNAEFNCTATAARENTLRRLPGEPRAPLVTAQCARGALHLQGHLQGTPRVKWSPVSCHWEPNQDFRAERGHGQRLSDSSPNSWGLCFPAWLDSKWHKAPPGWRQGWLVLAFSVVRLWSDWLILFPSYNRDLLAAWCPVPPWRILHWHREDSDLIIHI